jgi:hypothetical protein
MRPPIFFLLAAMALPAQAPPAPTPAEIARQQLEYTRAHYTKYDYRIAMRDGIRLFTTVYIPKDTSHNNPIVMQRTPYSVAPYGIDNYRGSLGPSDLSPKKASFSFIRTCAGVIFPKAPSSTCRRTRRISAAPPIRMRAPTRGTPSTGW